MKQEKSNDDLTLGFPIL